MSGSEIGAAQIAPGIDGRVVEANFVVNVRAGCMAGSAFVADHVAALYVSAEVGCKFRKVAVPGSDAEAVVDHDQAAVTGAAVNRGNYAVRRGANRVAHPRGDVHTRVKCTFSTKRIQPLAESPGNFTDHRP